MHRRPACRVRRSQSPRVVHRDHGRGTRDHARRVRRRACPDRARVHRVGEGGSASSPDSGGEPPEQVRGGAWCPHPRRTDCCPGAGRDGPSLRRRRTRRGCYLGADPQGGDHLERVAVQPQAQVHSRHWAVASMPRAPREERAQPLVERPARLPRAPPEPSPRGPSSRGPSSRGPCREQPAWPPSNDGQQAPRSWRRRSGRIRPTPAIWQGRPCSRPRAPSRARRPEPSTRLSCLGPG